MKRLSARERGLAVFVIAILACLLLVFFLVLPMRGTAADLAAEDRRLAAKIAEAERMYRQLPAALEEVGKLRAEYQQLFRAREQQVTPQVVREIGQVCADAEVTLNNVATLAPETIEDCVRHPVNFTVYADFAHIVSLMYKLEQQRNRLWVEGIEIGPHGRTGGLQAKVYVATYTVEPRAEVTDATR